MYVTNLDLVKAAGVARTIDTHLSLVRAPGVARTILANRESLLIFWGWHVFLPGVIVF